MKASINKMSKKQKFIDCIESAFFSKVDINELDPDIVSYWTAFKEVKEEDKPTFTDNGKMIMKYLQDNDTTSMIRAKDIAEGLMVSSRTVSGAIRKLVTDGFVEKTSENPVMYMITEKGKNINID